MLQGLGEMNSHLDTVESRKSAFLKSSNAYNPYIIEDVKNETDS